MQTALDNVQSIAPTRAGIARLKDEVRALPQVEVPTIHRFGPGFYARTVELEAGWTLIGKVHATEHVFIVSKGTLTVVTDGKRHTVSAPHQSIAPAGIERAVYCHTDVVCTNVHITEETDLVKLEAALIVADNLIEHEAEKWLG